MINNFTMAQKFAIWVVPTLFAITLHEVAHGYVAYLRGDPTAKILGRLTINPFKHIDIIGTVILPILMFMAGGIIFGWAKPVPVTPHNLKRRRLDMLLVSLAGPCANLLMALFWVAIAKLSIYVPGTTGYFLINVAYAGVAINIILMVLNLLPIPPLDGWHAILCLVPGKIGYHLSRLDPFGIFIIFILLFTGILGAVLGPLIIYTQFLFKAWFNL